MPPLKSEDVAIQQNNPPERRYFTSSKYSLKLLDNLNNLRTDSRFCDVEIKAGDQVFLGHRIILSSSSAYFEAMFRPELGLSEGKQKSVTLHTVSPDIFKMLLDFIYTGKILINQVQMFKFSCFSTKTVFKSSTRATYRKY